MFGLRVKTPRLTGTATLMAFALKAGKIDGNLVEANLALQYQVTQHFGIGGGLKSFFLDVTVEKTTGLISRQISTLSDPRFLQRSLSERQQYRRR